MSLADDLRAVRRSGKCPVGAYLDTLDGEDRAALEEALAAPPEEFPHKALAGVLKRHIPGGVSDNTVRGHRLAERSCACGPRKRWRGQ